MAWLDLLVFSSAWLALAAAALGAAAARALGVAPDPAVVAIAASGTLVVYNVDRLRDVERDRLTAPRRTAFVTRHAQALAALTAAAGVLSLGLGLALGPGVVAVLAPVLALGLAHRRLKRLAWLKSGYVSAAWLAVVVGLPAWLQPGTSRVAPVLVVLGTALLANAIGSNVRDREAAVPRIGPGRALGLARGCAGLGVAAGALAPAEVRPLLAVPLAVGAALLTAPTDERYGLVVLDGALLAGALLALGWMRLA